MSEMLKYISSIELIRHPNPRSGRMRYVNAMNNERNLLLSNVLIGGVSILARGKGENGRIIIGPKDFDRKFDPFFNVDTATQEELEKEFERTYPKELIQERLAVLQDHQNEAIQNVKNMQQLRKQSEDALKALGFGKDSSKQDKPDNPYE